jgi:hypothetical protein
MAPAAVLSFEETRQTFAKTRARQQLHAYLDAWLDKLEAHMSDERTRNEFRGKVVRDNGFWVQGTLRPW